MTNHENTTDEGLILAYRLDDTGTGVALKWSELQSYAAVPGFTWIHIDYTHARSQAWLKQHPGVDPIVCNALLAEETRPRSVVEPNGLLVVLRGVNLNPGSEPEDMISIRIWIGENTVITSCKRAILSVDDMRLSIEHGRGPRSPGEFLVALTGLLAERISDVVAEVDSDTDELEQQILMAENRQLRPMLGAVRRQVIALRRYLAPQREAMLRLSREKIQVLSDIDQLHLREACDRITRYVEDLDLIRERAAVAQEEFIGRLSEQMGSRMYVLSIVAAIFLPLGFLAGLLGINVGGIPGADNPLGFLVVCVTMTVLLGLQLLVFRKLGWL